jgi:ammonium transporter, Amt family
LDRLGNWQQFGVQVLGVAITATYSFVVTYLILKVLKVFEPVRVSEEVEAAGLDQVLHGETAYDLA